MNEKMTLVDRLNNPTYVRQGEIAYLDLNHTRDDMKLAADLIKKLGKQLRFYESNHRAKNTPDALEKAEVNRLLAEECES